MSTDEDAPHPWGGPRYDEAGNRDDDYGNFGSRQDAARAGQEAADSDYAERAEARRQAEEEAARRFPEYPEAREQDAGEPGYAQQHHPGYPQRGSYSYRQNVRRVESPVKQWVVRMVVCGAISYAAFTFGKDTIWGNAIGYFFAFAFAAGIVKLAWATAKKVIPLVLLCAVAYFIFKALTGAH